MQKDIRTIATRYIKKLSIDDREKVRTLVKRGIKVGVKYADTEGVDSNQFNDTLKAIFKE